MTPLWHNVIFVYQWPPTSLSFSESFIRYVLCSYRIVDLWFPKLVHVYWKDSNLWSDIKQIGFMRPRVDRSCSKAFLHVVYYYEYSSHKDKNLKTRKRKIFFVISLSKYIKTWVLKGHMLSSLILDWSGFLNFFSFSNNISIPLNIYWSWNWGFSRILFRS